MYLARKFSQIHICPMLQSKKNCADNGALNTDNESRRRLSQSIGKVGFRPNESPCTQALHLFLKYAQILISYLNFIDRGGNSNGGPNGDDGSEEWNAREEMRLLDAVEQFGYGNWKDISGFIETKTPEQASWTMNHIYLFKVSHKLLKIGSVDLEVLKKISPNKIGQTVEQPNSNSIKP